MKPDVTPAAPSLDHPHRDAHRRDRVQEGVAIVLALLVLVATFAVAAASVAGGTVPSASRTEGVGLVITPDGSAPCDQPKTITVIADGAAFTDRICSFGPHDLTPVTG